MMTMTITMICTPDGKNLKAGTNSFGGFKSSKFKAYTVMT